MRAPLAAAVLLGALLLAGCAAGVEPEGADMGEFSPPDGLEPDEDNGVAPDPNNHPPECIDRDGDSYGRGPGCRGPDCDDFDALAFDDCDNCQDDDGDGYGAGDGCRGPDCDDDNPDVNPRARELPNNGLDDDCQGGDLRCVDEDGDGYGDGADCRGPDCDDRDRAAFPGAREICGNQIDEDCQGGDEPCPSQCQDGDGDRYGVGDGCDGLDCDDNDPNVYVGRAEICNGKDDDCDDQTDECEDPLEACDPALGRCLSSFRGPCQQPQDCVQGLVCERDLCLGAQGTDCATSNDCARGFVCDRFAEVCAPDPDANVCDDLACERDDQLCLRAQARCVDCLEHADCDLACVGYRCGDAPELTFSSPARAFPEIAQALADCFTQTPDDGIHLCALVDAAALVVPLAKADAQDWICDDASAADFLDGAAGYEAAQAVMGCGFFNDEDIRWAQLIWPGSFWQWCLWSLPAASFLDEKDVVVAPCADFPQDGLR
jgi:hypothetical protein